MLIKNINDFVEFQNTEASKKLKEKEKPLALRFSLVKSTSSVLCTVSRALFNEMMRHDLERFKFFINEKSREILIRKDTSTKCIDLTKRKLQPNGVMVSDKFITYTFKAIFDKLGVTSLSYNCVHDDHLNLFLCSPIKEARKVG